MAACSVGMAASWLVVAGSSWVYRQKCLSVGFPLEGSRWAGRVSSWTDGRLGACVAAGVSSKTVCWVAGSELRSTALEGSVEAGIEYSEKSLLALLKWPNVSKTGAAMPTEHEKHEGRQD